MTESHTPTDDELIENCRKHYELQFEPLKTAGIPELPNSLLVFCNRLEAANKKLEGEIAINAARRALDKQPDLTLLVVEVERQTLIKQNDALRKALDQCVCDLKWLNDSELEIDVNSSILLGEAALAKAKATT